MPKKSGVVLGALGWAKALRGEECGGDADERDEDAVPPRVERHVQRRSRTSAPDLDAQSFKFQNENAKYT